MFVRGPRSQTNGCLGPLEVESIENTYHELVKPPPIGPDRVPQVSLLVDLVFHLPATGPVACRHVDTASRTSPAARYERCNVIKVIGDKSRVRKKVVR